MGNEQRVFRFANGYGASVIRGPYTYGGTQGLWEVAVVRFDGQDDFDFILTYETPITSDVEGRLDDAAVDALLAAIELLPSAP